MRDAPMLATVALLADVPAVGLVAGQVGTVVEPLDALTVLVEFATDDGAAYAVEALPKDRLLLLRYAPVAA